MYASLYRTRAQHPHNLWYDNFSKIYRIHKPTVGKGVYHSCMWTGVALNLYDGDPVDVSVKHHRDGSVIPAMPDDLFVELYTVTQTIQYIHEQGMFYYDNSLVVKYDVRTIPLKPTLPHDDPLAPGMERGSNNMSSTVPYMMLKDNIGSNLGLMKIMRTFYEERQMDTGECSDYHTLNVDENIFWRTIKVCVCLYVYVCVCVCMPCTSSSCIDIIHFTPCL